MQIAMLFSSFGTVSHRHHHLKTRLLLNKNIEAKHCYGTKLLFLGFCNKHKKKAFENHTTKSIGYNLYWKICK
jgi:hypothetical protein